MNGIFGAIASGVVAFIATNIDDLVILTIFFAQVPARLSWQNVVGGQYLGIMALILAALPGFLGGMFISKPLIGLLGFVPIVIGVSQWFKQESAEEEEEEVVHLAQVETNGETKGAIAHLLHPQTYSVAAVTFANGGDNIGIYVPLFASSNLVSLIMILATFLVMVAVWCFLAFNLARHPLVTRSLTRYGHIFVPIVFIALGIYILLENDSLSLLRR